MALTLSQAAVVSPEFRVAKVLKQFALQSPVLDVLPVKAFEGQQYTYNLETALPGVEFRAVNAAYTESTGTFGTRSETTSILGGDIDVDVYLQKTRSNLLDQLGTQQDMKVRAAGFKMNDTFINGDTTADANSFDGLKRRVTGSQIVDAATNGLSIIGDGSQAAAYAFMDKLDLLLSLVPGITPETGTFYCNDLIYAALLSSSRRAGLQTTTVEEYGKVAERFRGYRFVDIGRRGDGTRIIPQTEVQGSSSVASSIYLVKFGQDEGDGGVTGLTNSGNDVGQQGSDIFDIRDLGELQAKPVYRRRIEGYIGLAAFGNQPAARLRGLLP